MNLKAPKHPWNRLTAAVRRIAHERDTAAPFGFAARVAALALAQERKVASLFERFAFRALGAACALALMSVVVNYSSLGSALALVDDDLVEDDPVAVLLDT
ncbi:MAG: hypothetical protein EXS40_08470 [Opitutaceae bacterium]|nr:hypothetical protein [Opitutaceae bacterium]